MTSVEKFSRALLFLGVSVLMASPSQAQNGLSKEQAARRACWIEQLGSTGVRIDSAQKYKAMRACVKKGLGYDDPYMVKMEPNFSKK